MNDEKPFKVGRFYVKLGDKVFTYEGSVSEETEKTYLIFDYKSRSQIELNKTAVQQVLWRSI